jgi:ribosomal protein L30E
MNSGEMRSWQAFSHYIEELGGYISVLSEGGETTPFLFFDASALEAYMGEFQLYEPIHLEGRKPMEFVADVLERHSNHVCLRLWAVGVDIAGKSRQAVNAMYRDSNLTATLSAQVQANIKKINEKITGILESNSIILGANETLNFTVNQRREIIVGDGVSADKREQIEKLLNADKTLAQELLYSHAERRVATNSSPINTSLSTQSCDENMVFHWMISNYPNSEWIPMHLIGDLAIL